MTFKTVLTPYIDPPIQWQEYQNMRMYLNFKQHNRRGRLRQGKIQRM